MLELDIVGVKFEFGIEEYRPSTREHWDDEWCLVSVKVKSDIIDYSIYSHCMMCCDVEWLYKNLIELQDETINEDTEVSFVEPDFEYML